MKRLFIIIILVISSVSYSYSTNLRGYIQRCNKQYGCYPSTFTKIQLFYWDGYKWSPGTYTYTGQDGYYYFYNIYPTHYYVLVNDNVWYQIDVINLAWQDIPILTYYF